MSATATEPKTPQQLAEEAEKSKLAADAAKAKEEEGLKPVGAPAMDFINRALNQTTKAKKDDKGEKTDGSDDDDDDLKELREEPKPKKAAPKKAAPKSAPASQPVIAFDEEKLGEAVGRAVAAATKPKEPDKDKIRE